MNTFSIIDQPCGNGGNGNLRWRLEIEAASGVRFRVFAFGVIDETHGPTPRRNRGLYDLQNSQNKRD